MSLLIYHTRRGASDLKSAALAQAPFYTLAAQRLCPAAELCSAKHVYGF